MTNIIIIDEDKEHFKQTEKMLCDHYTVIDFDSIEDPYNSITNEEDYLILLSVSYEKKYFLSLLADFKQFCPHTPILLTCNESHFSQELKDIYSKMSLKTILKSFKQEELLTAIQSIEEEQNQTITHDEK